LFGALVKLVAKDEFDERDKFMRANLDAMAKRSDFCWLLRRFITGFL
jgi:hypothetical protein